MKPQMQLQRTHLPHLGLYGDCYRTCIAMLLDMDAADVPHFAQIALEEYNAKDGSLASHLARDWLRQRGYSLVHIPFGQDAAPYVLDWFGPHTPYILTGASPSGAKDYAHCVVAAGDLQTVCDPSDLGTSKLQPYYDAAGNQYIYWIEFIFEAHSWNYADTDAARIAALHDWVNDSGTK